MTTRGPPLNRWYSAPVGTDGRVALIDTATYCGGSYASVDSSLVAAVAGSVIAAEPSAGVSWVSVGSAPGATDLVGYLSDDLVIFLDPFNGWQGD